MTRCVEAGDCGVADSYPHSAQMPPLDESLKQRIAALTEWDQLLYQAAEQR